MLRQVSGQDSVTRLQSMTICFLVIEHLSSSSLPGCCVTGNGSGLSHSSLPICNIVLMPFAFVADTQVEQVVNGEPG